LAVSRRAADIISNSGVAFGTSGARGLVEQFTNEVCAAFTVAFLTVMREQSTVARVAIGLDRRPSSPAMAAACTAAARAVGMDVLDYGVLPTPALALQAMAEGVPAIMITGSHIPFDRNGIKFYRPDGEISKADEQAILQVAAELPALDDLAREPVSDAANERYLSRYSEWFSGQPLAGKRVGLYQHSAAGRDLTVQVLETLGARVVPLGLSEEFVPVDTEAVSEADRKLGRDWVAEHQLDALLTTDGDGDRPLLADERGEWLRGDVVGLLCARELGIEALAVPVSCNTAIEACGALQKVERTRIGSPYVLAAMEQLKEGYRAVAGFEANGGFMLGSPIQQGNKRLEALPTRDALLPAIALMVAAARKGHPLLALVEGLPARYTASDRLKAFPTERSRSLLATWADNLSGLQNALSLESSITGKDTTDGLRVTLQSGDIVHLRPSGNAPELRCYVEAGSSRAADALLDQCMRALSEL